MPTDKQGFLRNCYVLLKPDEKAVLFTNVDGPVVASLDNYAIVPMEILQALVNSSKTEPVLLQRTLSQGVTVNMEAKVDRYPATPEESTEKPIVRFEHPAIQEALAAGKAVRPIVRTWLNTNMYLVRQNGELICRGGGEPPCPYHNTSEAANSASWEILDHWPQLLPHELSQEATEKPTEEPEPCKNS